MALQPGRRGFLTALGSGLLVSSLTVPLAACGGGDETPAEEGSEAPAAESAAESVPDRDDTEAMTWKEARKRLEEGNARFVKGAPAHPDAGTERRSALGTGKQRPFVSVLACADSRVPPEMVFDQGLGDLFTVRSAGQVVDHAVLGTLQFGVAEFGTPLLVVLGHSKCGAVKATLEAMEKKSPASGTDVDVLVRAIGPAITEAEELGTKPDDLLSVSVDVNVDHVVTQLEEQKVLSAAVRMRKLKILGAVYDLESGEVTFL